MVQNSEINAPKAKKTQKISKDFKNNIKNLATNNVETPLEFPLDVFPDVLQKVIKEQNIKANFDLDITSSSILGAYGIAIGNLFKANVRDTYKASSTIWLIIASPAGANKSTPLSWSLEQIKAFDNKNYKQYSKEFKEFDNYQKLSKKEKLNVPIVEKPIFKSHTTTDSTIEKLGIILNENPKGIGIHSDEIKSFIESLSRYNGGGDLEKYLSIWSNETLNIQRVGREPIYVQNANVSILGTIQTDLLIDTLKKSMDKNGFNDRFLWVIKPIKPAKATKVKPNKTLLKEYDKAINKVLNINPTLDLEGYFCSNLLEFTPESEDILLNWQHKNTDLQLKNEKNQHYVSAYAKLEIYVYRLALILELIEWSFSEVETIPTQINIKAASNAITLIEYFRNFTHKYFSLLSNIAAIDSIKDSARRDFYETLTDDFKQSEALELANKFKLSNQQVKRFLGDKRFFDKISHGFYSKKY